MNPPARDWPGRWLVWLDVSGRRWMLVLAAIAIVARVGWAACMADRQPQLDERAYFGHAARLAAGLGYVDAQGAATSFWPVGYPALLSVAFRLAGPNLGAGVALQILLGIATCLLLSLLGERWLGRRPGRLAALLLALYPNQVFYATLLLTEPLVTLLVLAAAGCLLAGSARPVAGGCGAGLLFGAAALTRPVLVLLPLLVPLWALACRLPWRRAILVSAVAGAMTASVVAPWLARNQPLSGKWTDLSSSGGQNFWVGNHPRALGGIARPRGIDAPLRAAKGWDLDRGYRLGWESMAADPAAALLRAGNKVSYFVALETDGLLWNLKGRALGVSHLAALPGLAAANVAYLLLLLSASLGLLSSPRPRAVAVFFLLLAAHLLVASVVFLADPRYHFPLVPFALLFSAKAILTDLPLLRAGLRAGDATARRRAMRWAVLCGLLLVLVAWNLLLRQRQLSTPGMF